MSKHYTMRPPKFTLDFKPSEKATVHGGQLAVVAILEEFELKKKIQRIQALDPRSDTNKGYEPIIYVTGILIALTSGDCTLAGVEQLNGDEALKAFLGVKRFPDESSVGEWLRNIGPKGVKALKKLHREFVAWVLGKADPRRYQQAGQTECFFDDTQIEVSGHHFEGAQVNYNGDVALGWQTLWVGPFIAGEELGAPGEVSSQLPKLLEENRSLWQKESAHLYADSASSAGTYVRAVEEAVGSWSISYNKWTEPLERTARALPEGVWSAAAERRGRKGEPIREQYAWVRHQPDGCEHPLLFATARYKESDELFWRYSFVAVNEQTGAPQGAIERHRLKGDYERRFSDVLSDLDLHHPPCKSLEANRAYYTLGSFAHNILRALQLLHLPDSEQGARVRTLIHRLLLIPVEIKRHARSLAACFYAPKKLLSWWVHFLRTHLARCRLTYSALAPPVPA